MAPERRRAADCRRSADGAGGKQARAKAARTSEKCAAGDHSLRCNGISQHLPNHGLQCINKKAVLIRLNLKFGSIPILDLVRFGCAFQERVLPEGLAKELSKMYKSQNIWILLTVVQWFHPFQHANSMQRNILDAFKHVPDLFGRAPGPETHKQIPKT